MVKAMFTLIVFEILLFEARSVLSLTQRGTGSKKLMYYNRNIIKVIITINYFDDFSL